MRRNSVGCFSPFSIYIKTLSASEEKGVFRHHVMFSDALNLRNAKTFHFLEQGVLR